MRFLEFFNDIQFKGNKANILLKWVIGIAGVAVVGAFIVGQLKMRHLDKLDDIEAIAIKGMKKTEQLEIKMDEGFKEQNDKINKIYEDGIEAFEDYRQFNNQQMQLIIDYSDENKDLLKKMLKINSKERAMQIENNLQRSKKESTTSESEISINIQKLKPSKVVFTEVATGIKHHHISNAPENYLDTLDLTKYKIIEKKKSVSYEGLYDFHYVTKK